MCTLYKIIEIWVFFQGEQLKDSLEISNPQTWTFFRKIWLQPEGFFFKAREDIYLIFNYRNLFLYGSDKFLREGLQLIQPRLSLGSAASGPPLLESYSQLHPPLNLHQPGYVPLYSSLPEPDSPRQYLSESIPDSEPQPRASDNDESYSNSELIYSEIPSYIEDLGDESEVSPQLDRQSWTYL